MRKSLLASALFILIFPSLGWPLHDETHPIINKSVARNNFTVFDFDSYLKIQLGFSNGSNQEIKAYSYSDETLTIYNWLGKGGEYEDLPPELKRLPLRTVNHFHNPLKETLEEAALSADWVDIIMDGLSYDNTSAIKWAQADAGTQSLGGNYSWHDARNYFYNALTNSVQTERENNFAQTFRAVGQVLHLLQDMSVPEHTRNAPHNPSDYEKWVRDNLSDEEKMEAFFPINPGRTNFCGQTISSLNNFFDISLLANQPSPFDDATVPIAWLFDTNIYTGSNPDDSDQANIGLAEYSNANFVNEGTMFSETITYPNRETSVSDQDCDIPDPHVYADTIKSPWGIEAGINYSTVKRPYWLKTADGDTGYILAGQGYAYYYLDGMDWTNEFVYLTTMDDYVLADYATLLLPKAIGYSSNLLQYFFRGMLEVGRIQVPNNNPYVTELGAIGWSDPISQISAEVRNISELGLDIDSNPIFEQLGLGMLVAIARYKTGDENFLYSVSSEISVDANLAEELNGVVPKELSFDFDPAIPAGATELSLQVVFKGTLGAEEDVAVAVGRSEFVAGTLEVTYPEEYVYSIIDGSQTPYNFTKIKASVRNTTTMVDDQGASVPVELTGGNLFAVATYRVIPDLMDDLSNYPQDASTLQATMEGVDFFSSISATIVVDPANNPVSLDQGNIFTFDFTGQPIPAGITDLQLFIYYMGYQSIDNGSVVALASKDLNEPQHLTFWNDTDYFLLYGVPVLADDIRDDPDVSDYGYIDPHRITEYIGFSAEYPVVDTPPLVTINLLDAARYSRFIILTDNPAGYFITDRLQCHWIDDSIWADNTFKYDMPAFVNQETDDNTWLWTPMYTVRGITQHQRSYYMNYYLDFYYINSLPAPSENSVGATPVTINFP